MTPVWWISVNDQGGKIGWDGLPLTGLPFFAFVFVDFGKGGWTARSAIGDTAQEAIRRAIREMCCAMTLAIEVFERTGEIGADLLGSPPSPYGEADFATLEE